MNFNTPPFTLKVIALISGILTSQYATAKIVADYKADFSPQNQSVGWSYKWNPTGIEIGNSAEYVDLQTRGKWRLVADANRAPGKGLEGPINATKLELKQEATWIPGESSIDSSDELCHYVIAAYTIQSGEAGVGSLKQSRIQREYEKGTGEIRVYVNDRLIGSGIVNGSEASAFNVELGDLAEGDTIYVAYARTDVVKKSRATIVYQIDIAQ